MCGALYLLNITQERIIQRSRVVNRSVFTVIRSLSVVIIFNEIIMDQGGCLFLYIYLTNYERYLISVFILFQYTNP